MRILLVDDDLVFAKLVVTKLAELGLRDVTVAQSAEQALGLLDQGSSTFDCFLLDIVLGNSDGIDLCHNLRMRADNKLAPIIMVTSQRHGTFMSRAFIAGATDFLRKPLDHNELVGRIKTAMLLVELTKKNKASIGGSKLPPSHTYLSQYNAPLEPVWIPKINGLVKYSYLQKKLSELSSPGKTPNLYRVQIKDFGVLFRQKGSIERKRYLHQISNLLSEAVSEDQVLFSYLGRGRFILCLQDQDSKEPDETAMNLQNRINLRLDQSPSAGSIVLELRVSDITGPFPSAPNLETNNPRGTHSVTRDALMLNLPQVDDIEDRMFEKDLAQTKRQDVT